MRRALALLTTLASLAAPSSRAQQDAGPAAPKAEAARKDAGRADGGTSADPVAVKPNAATVAAGAPLDPDELRRQILEEVRRELQKTKDEVRKETEWVSQDSEARAQDGEVLESIKQRVNFFQPHGYLRMRGEFFNNFDLGRGADRTGHTLFPIPFIGTGGNHSQSDINFRFRFSPKLEISEDLSIHAQADILDNVVLGSDAFNTPYLDPSSPLAIMNSQRLGSTVNIKRLWGRVNTQVGEFTFGRMPYHFGMGILHNDGNGLDQDFGDTYDRLAFTPRDISKGHRITLMFDLLDKGATTTGEHGELGRSVDLDTLDDGYRLGVQVVRLDTDEEVKAKLAANEWVVNYGLVVDYRTQSWDTPVISPVSDVSTLGGAGLLRNNVARRAAKLYQPDVFLTLRRKKWHLDLEIASTIGSVATRAVSETASFDTNANQPLTFLQFGGALQTDVALLPADALLLGLEFGAASGDKGVYGFGARPWRSGSGGTQGPAAGGGAFNATGYGDIDGSHIDFSDPAHSHGRINNFQFNRAFNVDMILWRNLITTVTGAFYIKPSIRYRPTGRKSGGGDDSGFELTAAIIYSQAFYAENTPGQSTPLGAELNVGITYDTADRLHTGLQYGLLLPFSGLKNPGDNRDPALSSAGSIRDASIAHAVRFTVAIPF